MAGVSTGEARRAGRRRDPSLDPRLLSGAIEVYAREGWRGFTFDKVARVANVGKPAIYRRWATRELLLVTAFNRTHFPTARDLGSFEDDVRDFVEQWLTWYATPFLPQAGSRFPADCASNPELARLYDEIVIAPRGKAVRAVTRRAIDRGEVHPDLPATLLPDIVLGSMNMHWAFSPNRESPEFAENLRNHASDLITVLMRSFLR
ncbi:TetR-like C-terminal domain-containing protein [Tomitella fengzijianii]|uniref:TetR/AcrR family transcriptional regulator n=1 Tax=Tomitella fengzijianii TaxID=2597660 RepID=A0A516WZ55_9ACTN|nr:TetR-like C-terminal domain-containing protein [Tomitella fengzijianii]QDQ96030.1 TetR/AcrR family transcriptional regulator [Tomitella fengzijianii]